MAISIDGTNGLTTDNAALKLDGTTLVVDDTNNRVGIGTSSPSYKLDLYDSSGDASINVKSNGTYSNILFSRNGSGGDVRVRADVSNNNLQLITAGSERLRIDSAGRVTMPYQPAFAVYKSGSQATNTPAAQLTGWLETFNTGGHFSTATSRFTAPLSGKYLINYTGLHHSGGVSSGYWVRVYLTVNGAAVVDGLGDNGTYGNYQRLSLSQVLSLNAGDYVTLLVESAVASSVGVYSGYTHWSGFLIG